MLLGRKFTCGEFDRVWMVELVENVSNRPSQVFVAGTADKIRECRDRCASVKGLPKVKSRKTDPRSGFILLLGFLSR
jgi:hypothetical protein